jgi:hypothetical protein
MNDAVFSSQQFHSSTAGTLTRRVWEMRGLFYWTNGICLLYGTILVTTFAAT